MLSPCSNQIRNMLQPLFHELRILRFNNIELLHLLSKFNEVRYTEFNTILLIGNYLLRLGLPRSNLVKLLLNYPRLTICDKYECHQKKIGYILKVTKLPFLKLMRNPTILKYSIERIVTRLEFVRSKAPVLIKKYSLAYWIQTTDEVFVKGRLCHGTCEEYFKFKEKMIIRLSKEEKWKIKRVQATT